MMHFGLSVRRFGTGSEPGTGTGRFGGSAPLRGEPRTRTGSREKTAAIVDAVRRTDANRLAALPALASRNLPSTSTPAAVAGGPCYGGPAVVYSPTSPDPSPLRRRVLDVETTFGDLTDGVLWTAITLRADVLDAHRDGSRKYAIPRSRRGFDPVRFDPDSSRSLQTAETSTENADGNRVPTPPSALEAPTMTPAPLPAPPPPPPSMPRRGRRRLVDAPIHPDPTIAPPDAQKSASGARGATQGACS